MNSLFSVMTGDLLNLLLNLQKQILSFYFRREGTLYLGVKITIKIDNVDRDFEERLEFPFHTSPVYFDSIEK